MSIQTDLPFFERVGEARGRLLRVEGDRAGPTPRQLVMTFETARLWVEPAPDGFSVRTIEDREEIPVALVPLEEEEPWWRVLGQPLTAAWPGGIESGAQESGPLLALKLRFREESENPRTVLLESAGSAIRVSLEG
jgi:hypothetical protein